MPFVDDRARDSGDGVAITGTSVGSGEGLGSAEDGNGPTEWPLLLGGEGDGPRGLL